MRILFDVMKKSSGILHEQKMPTIFWHILGWTVFIIYEITLFLTVRGSLSTFWNTSLHYMLNMVLFYLHYLVVFPIVFRHKNIRAFWLLLYLSLELCGYVIFSYYFDLFLGMVGLVEVSKGFEFNLTYCIIVFYRAMYFALFSSAYYFILKSFKEQKLAAKLERERLDSLVEYQKMQNAFLKAQINPHFLFNTLNFIYNKTRKAAPDAGEAILSLSQIMRYAINSDNASTESNLMQEIDEVENLINLHRIRLNDSLNLEFIYGDNLAELKIIPLILITLVENVFKHGDLSVGGFKASIQIHYDNQELTIETHNLKNSNVYPSHNIGLTNINNRMSNHYGDNYSFETGLDERNIFHVSLKIKMEKAIA